MFSEKTQDERAEQLSFCLRKDSPALLLGDTLLNPINDWLSVREQWMAYRESNFKLLLAEANSVKMEMVSNFTNLEELVCESTNVASQSFTEQLKESTCYDTFNVQTAWLTEEERNCFASVCDVDENCLILEDNAIVGSELQNQLLERMGIQIIGIPTCLDDTESDEESEEEIYNGDLIESDEEMECE